MLKAAEPAAAVAVATCDSRLADARRLAAESSWALARDAYAEALKLAPDADARRWCELWSADAAWRGGEPRDWQARQAWEMRHKAAFERLLEPYAKGSARDDFWAAATEARGVFVGRQAWWMALDDWISVATFLGEQPRTTAAGDRLISFLQRVVGDREIQSWQMMDRFLPLLARGIEVGATPDQRAWCALTLASLERGDMKEKAAGWKRALDLATGTRWALLARAQEFLWRAETGWNPTAVAGSAVDVPVMVREAVAVREVLGQTPAEESLKHRLREFEQRLAGPLLNVTCAGRFLPGGAMGFVYGATGFDRLDVTIYEHTPESWARAKLKPSENPLETVARQIRTWTIALPSAAELRWKSEVVPLPQKLPPGLYTLAVRGSGGTGEKKQLVDFIVSDFGGILVAETDGRHSLFLFNQASRIPVAGKRVEGLVVDANGLPSWLNANGVRSWGGTTDSTGRVDLSIGNFVQMVAVVEGQPVLVEIYGWGARRAGSLAADFFLDRALYRPGETAKWKMIVRGRRDGRWVAPGEKLEMSVRLDDEPLVGKKEVTLNRFGTAHGEIAIPVSARAGQAYVELKLAGEGDEPLERQSFFAVDNFVPPALTAKLELASGAGSLRPGREIVVRVAAAYLSGGPAVGARVELKLQASRFPWANLSRASADEGQFDQWIAKAGAEQRESATDACGAAEFPLRLPERIPGTISLQFAATVVPDGGQAVQANASWQVFPAGRALEADDWTSPRLVRPADPVSFECRVRDGTGGPVAFTGVAQLLELRWIGLFLNPQGQTVDRLPDEAAGMSAPWNPEPPMPKGWTRLFADLVETVVADKPLQVASDGKLKIDFTPPKAGIYRLNVMDANGEALSVSSMRHGMEKPLVIVAADEHIHTLPFRPSAIAVFVPGRVRADQPLTAFVVLPEGETSAVAMVTGEDETSSQRVDLAGRAGLVTFRQWPRCAGQGRIMVTSLKGLQSNAQAMFPVDGDRGELKIELRADSANPRPGAAARVEVGVTRKAGGEVRSEFALAVSDEAVNGLAGRPTEESVAFFQNRIGGQPRIGRSLELSSNKPAAFMDPRPGAVVLFGQGGNAIEGSADQDQVVVLSPFVVEAAGATGYVALATLAGTRVRTDLKNVGSAISVVTEQFLKDTGATNNEALLTYGTSSEVAGLAGRSSGEPPLPIAIRTHFASTAFWAPEVVTNEKGQTTVEFKYPDNLTQWRIEAYAVGEDGNSFGRAATFARTSLPFQARLQTPRFLVAGDTAQPSALLVNRTDSELKANADLKVDGAVVPVGAHLDAPSSGESIADRAQQAAPLREEGIVVPKQGEARTAWTVKATQPGEATLTLTARAGPEGDAMVTTLPVLEDGIQQETAANGRLAGDAQQQSFDLPLPGKLDLTRTTVTLQLSPGHVSAILDALPYLVDYPYGCVEQTMSRFLPAVVVRKTLADFGLNAAAVERRMLSRESNADAVRRGKTAGLGKLDDVVEKSLTRLREAQLGNGGFGWWPEAQLSDVWMTAYVAWGLGLARAAGIDVPDDLAKNTNTALIRILAGEPPPPDVNAWALAALARAKPDEIDAKAAGDAFYRGYGAREKLSAAGRACLALAAVRFGDDAQRAVLLRNLENGAERAQTADSGDTVHWGLTVGYWRAMDSAVESTALTLLALLELDPKHPFVEPAANWLALNRRSADWASTRDTTFAVLALARYVEVRREFAPDAGVEVVVNGQSLRTVRFTRESLLDGPVTIALGPSKTAEVGGRARPLGAPSTTDGPAVRPYLQANSQNTLELLRPGANRIELHRISGNTPVYAVALASAWAPSDVVKPAGHLLAVDRGFVREKAQATLMGALKITSEPMADGGAAAAGEQVTAKVTLYVTNELEYVMVEVPKPAGCEPLNPLSGWDARMRRVETSDGFTSGKASAVGSAGASASNSKDPDEGRAIYREERDDKSVFFLDHVEAGTWEIRFGLRATTPGDYRALPVQASAMYVPEVRANGDARRVKIETRDSESSSPKSLAKQ